jgi:hypothetical protein
VCVRKLETICVRGADASHAGKSWTPGCMVFTDGSLSEADACLLIYLCGAVKREVERPPFQLFP